MRRALLLLGSVIALGTASPAYAANGLVASWPFDEGSGTAVHDTSGHGNNGVISGDAQWVDGFAGSALSFDGNTGRVRVPDSASLDPTTAVSVSAWIRATEPQGDFNYILAKGASGCLAASYGLYTGPNGGMMFYVARNRGLSYTRSPDAGHDVWNGRWHLVVGTYDSNSVRLYLDGSQVGNGTAHTGPIDYDFPDNDLFIGHYNTCPTEDFHGEVDSAQIYNHALNASEVRSEYDAGTQSGQPPSSAGSAPVSTGTGSGNSGTASTQGHPGPGAAPSSVGAVSLSGLDVGKPSLIVHFAARNGATPIKSLTVSLPAGLSFTHNLKLLRRGVSITGAGPFRLSLTGHKLVVLLRQPTISLRMSIRSPALTEAHPLVRRAHSVISFNRTRSRQQKKRVLKLKLTLQLTDAARNSTPVGRTVVVS